MKRKGNNRKKRKREKKERGKKRTVFLFFSFSVCLSPSFLLSLSFFFFYSLSPFLGWWYKSWEKTKKESAKQKCCQFESEKCHFCIFTWEPTQIPYTFYPPWYHGSRHGSRIYSHRNIDLPPKRDGSRTDPAFIPHGTTDPSEKHLLKKK